MTFNEALDALLEDTSIAPSAIVKFASAFEYPMFSRDQPAIGAYSQKNPENMAKLLCFVLCTQQTEWPRMTALFGHFWEYLVRHNGDVTYGTNYVKGGKKMWKAPENPKETNMPVDLQDALRWWGNSGKPFEFVWKNRGQIYNHIMSALEQDKKVGDTGFLLYQALVALAGYGLPKAAFMAQLINGKMGCIDSINLNILGDRAPRDIMDPKGKTFKSPGFVADSSLKGKTQDEIRLLRFLHGKLTTGGLDMIKKYVDFLDDLKKNGTTSEVLWDTWCEVVANRIQYFKGDPLHVYLPHQDQNTPRVIKTYKNSTLDHLARSRASMPTPWNSKAGGSVVSADHRRLVTGESKAVSFVNLFEERIVNFHQEFGNFIILVGSPAAGKSTVVKNLLNLRGVKHLNPDIWAEIIQSRDKEGKSLPKHIDIPPEFDRPIDLHNPKAAGFMNVALSRQATTLRDLTINKKDNLQNIVWETSCRNMEAFDKTVATVKQSGYTVTLVYVWVPLEMAQERNLARKERMISPESVESSYYRVVDNLDKLVASSDHAWRVDNTEINGKVPTSFRSSKQITRLK